jgi:antitoxin component YwqK of YwqJK toxin-antitoxin module
MGQRGGPPEIAGMMDQMTKSHDVMVEKNFKDGVLHGKIVDYNWNGGINFEVNLKEGEKDGVWRQYFETPMGTGQGALKKISIYKDDQHISSKYYDFENADITKEEALNDEEWGGEAWEQDTSFL